MRIATIGTGVVGRTLARGLGSVGHDLVVGTRDPEITRAREDWIGTDIALATSLDAVGGVDLVVNATNGQASLAALADLDLAGKVFVGRRQPLGLSRPAFHRV